MRSLLILLFFISCGQPERPGQAQPKEIEIANYIFDFNSNFQLHTDTNKLNSGFIEGQGISIEYAGGWIPIEQSKILEDTTIFVVEIDTMMNLFRKVVYNKNSSDCVINMILTDTSNLKRIDPVFPDNFIGLIMTVKEITKQQQDELLKIFKSGRQKLKDDPIKQL